jgi:hypothetical protein
MSKDVSFRHVAARLDLENRIDAAPVVMPTSSASSMTAPSRSSQTLAGARAFRIAV